MIYITGDMHGVSERFKDRKLKKLKKSDTLIVCGDFGFVWNGSKKEKRVLKWIGKRRYNVLFVPGSHENYALLKDLEEKEFAGSKARSVSGKLWCLTRGNIYTIEGKTVFAFGGGECEDRDMREENVTWFPQELPAPEELAYGEQNLKDAGNQVDYIITHEAPFSVKEFLAMDDNRQNPMLAFFERIGKTVSFKKWYFGHYHIDRKVTSSHIAVYKEVVAVD